MVKKNPQTTIKEFMEEMSSIGIDVNGQTVTNTLRCERLRKYQTKRAPLGSIGKSPTA